MKRSNGPPDFHQVMREFLPFLSQAYWEEAVNEVVRAENGTTNARLRQLVREFLYLFKARIRSITLQSLIINSRHGLYKPDIDWVMDQTEREFRNYLSAEINKRP